MGKAFRVNEHWIIYRNNGIRKNPELLNIESHQVHAYIYVSEFSFSKPTKTLIKTNFLEPGSQCTSNSRN